MVGFSKALSMEQAQDIFSSLRRSIGNNSSDEDLRELHSDFPSGCVRYAAIRAEWSVSTREKQMDMDSSRTMAHDSVLMNIKILLHYMTKCGYDTSWSNEIIPKDIDITQAPYRKVIGDLACHITDILAVEARKGKPFYLLTKEFRG